MLEMEGDNLSTEQILDRLGKSQDLAKAYLGDLLSAQCGGELEESTDCLCVL